MTGDDDVDRFLHCTPKSFARLVIDLEPGARLDHEACLWQDAILLVTAGEIDVECSSGDRHSFGRGDILSLAPLAIRRVHNSGVAPAQVLAIWRRTAPTGSPVNFREPGRHTDTDPDLE